MHMLVFFLCSPKNMLIAFILIIKKFFIVVQVQLSPFSPHHGPLPHPSLPPTLEPAPFGFVHVSFIHVP